MFSEVFVVGDYDFTVKIKNSGFSMATFFDWIRYFSFKLHKNEGKGNEGGKGGLKY